MEAKDVLILVKTYPEYSAKYTETVCTAGILAENKKLIRLYPIRYRYLDGINQFSKYQWINLKLSKAASDSRPESYNSPYAVIFKGCNFCNSEKADCNALI